ncbi:MAG: [Fe-Fe] hydrogenase large subunit C-terminal domain-containing protein [Holophaga sp.]|nr:[Fe-Fe] hydrogenase large subunit C-terminal domain-containing protein [Holophaga sp.]
MNSQQPIFTEKARCQDCYKCVRECPVKAIQVVDDSAAVMPERCVYCGNCVNVCPVGAKKVRDDLGRAKLLLKRKTKVIASLAPSFVSEFPGVEPGRLIHALRILGFSVVSETALGAEEVSAACAVALENGGPGAYISTACPTVVELIRRYHPDQLPSLTRLVSPLLAHCKLLQREFGEDIGIVFIGPCISKKLEADARPELLDVVLTFADLRRWLEERGIDPAAEPFTEADVFLPKGARDGALYPADGGMNRGIAHRQNTADVKFMAFSGIHYLQEAMEGLRGQDLKQKLFLELLACEGGCVNGPQVGKTCGTALKWLQVLDYASEPLVTAPRPSLDLYFEATASPVQESCPDPIEIARALRRLGKTVPEDELNCGGCGYDNCRGLAVALLEGWAEPNMCVSYMRKLAMNKANALIRSMPAGVVIVDENLMVVECNRRFAETLGGDTPMIFDAKPGMEGADIVKLAPEMRSFFARGLESDIEALRKDVRVEDRVLRLTVFTVEPGRIVGGVLQDITEPAVQREQIMQKAQEVIRKNVTTVQQIAYLLGENAAETEMILESLSSSFRAAPSPLGGPGPDEDSHRGR